MVDRSGRRGGRCLAPDGGFALTGRLGRYHRRTPRTDTYFFSERKQANDSGYETTVGLGIEWYLQARLSLIVDAESFEGGWFNESRGANMTTLALRYRF